MWKRGCTLLKADSLNVQESRRKEWEIKRAGT
jgi:hypothetical protein